MFFGKDEASPVGKVLSRSEIEKLQKSYLNEKPEQTQRDVETIRQWILSQPHLGPNARSGIRNRWGVMKSAPGLSNFRKNENKFSTNAQSRSVVLDVVLGPPRLVRYT